MKARVRATLPQTQVALGAGDWAFFAATVALSLVFVLIPAVIFMVIRRISRHRRENRQLVDDLTAFVDRASLTVAYPLMVNSMLLKPGVQTAPGLFLVSPDRATGNDLKFNYDLVETITIPESPPLSAAEAAWCQEVFFDEQFTPLRLRRVPPTITAGRPVYAADLAIDGRLLFGRAISEDNVFLPCLFDEASRMCLILPIWTLGDAEPTAQERDVLTNALRLQWILKQRAAG